MPEAYNIPGVPENQQPHNKEFTPEEIENMLEFSPEVYDTLANLDPTDDATRIAELGLNTGEPITYLKVDGEVKAIMTTVGDFGTEVGYSEGDNIV